jgi:anti-anti-sigma regulatory factor
MSFSAVDLLARLQLEARRRGVELSVRAVAPALRELIALAGLEEPLRVEPGREPEQREERGGVEEEGQLPDTFG